MTAEYSRRDDGGVKVVNRGYSRADGEWEEAEGKAYFVGDDNPLPLFEFMRPLIEGIGFKVPRINIPYRPVLAFLRLWQFLHFRIGIPAPPFAPHEIRKLAISHSGSNKEAERDFGYHPIVKPADAMARSLAYYKARRE